MAWEVARAAAKEAVAVVAVTVPVAVAVVAVAVARVMAGGKVVTVTRQGVAVAKVMAKAAARVTVTRQGVAKVSWGTCGSKVNGSSSSWAYHVGLPG